MATTEEIKAYIAKLKKRIRHLEDENEELRSKLKGNSTPASREVYSEEPSPVVTEQTGKKWKAMQLIGILGIVAFLGALGIDWILATSGGEAGFVSTLGVLGLLIGFPLWLVGRVGAWWHHG